MAKIKTSSTEFNALFEEYNSYVFKIVINETNNKLTKEDIEEVVADIFFSLWKNYKKLKDPKKIKPYIGKIAKNTAKNRLRSLKKEFSFDDDVLSDSYREDRSYSVKEQLKIVHKALEKMDIIDKKIFLMYYYENKKIKEIAKLEGIKSSTIKTRLYRTRKKLKKILERRGYRNGL